MIDIVNDCFNETKAIVMITEDSKKFSLTSELISSPSIILINKNIKWEIFNNKIYFPYYSQNLSQTLLVIKSSMENLYGYLNNLKYNSNLWNTNRLTIITDLIEIKNSHDDCNDKAQKYLLTAWKLELLRVIYLCFEDKNLKLFSYNPYTNEAPKPWIIDKIIPGIHNHPWTLFKQYYNVKKSHENNLICKSLIFDQTNDLGQYPVNVSFVPSEPSLVVKKINGMITFTGMDAEVNLLSLLKMNATINSTKTHRSMIIKLLDVNNNETIDKNDDDSFYYWDIFIVSMAIFSNGNLIPTDLRIPVKFTTISKIKYLSNFELILQSPLRLYIIFLSFGLIFIFIYYIKYKKLNNFLIILKIILSISLIDLPKKLYTRIVLFFIIIFFFIMNTIYPGDLVSSLTVAKTQYNIEEISDINNLNYKIYVEKFLIKLLDLNDINNLHVLDKNHRFCYENITQNNEACITLDPYARRLKKSSKLWANEYHLPKKALFTRSESYLYRKTWPPSKRFNDYHLKIMESGLLMYWEKNTHVNLKISKDDNVSELKKLNFHDLKMTFFFLITSLFITIIVFIVEIILNYFNRVF
ncbi:hypothetical protein HCN44_005073 [Aphidius gifuensis]|uniref:Ionotropic receptor n=1 Tax=Aphidius gifuensis TaxID=684658 RepID=A0A835CQC2_APHGI|nr:hypothetical protein HCN44_005073 [Aphidius gifuensis]